MKITESELRKLVNDELRKLIEGGPGSGPQGDDDKEDNPFDREPSDDDLKDIEKQFEEKIVEADDHEGKMAKSQLERSMKYSKMIYKMIDNFSQGKEVQFPAWVQSKLTKSMDYLQSVYNYLDGKDGLEDKFQDDSLDEAGSIGGALNMSDINTSYIAPKRDTKGGMKTFHQKFSSPEAKSIIDGQLKMMAKDLRKVQNRVIKTWMQGAKSGAIDFFDIIRGLKTGDVSRAHPYEVDFLVNVLTKDKIIDRFRSYFKGKKGKSSRTK